MMTENKHANALDLIKKQDAIDLIVNEVGTQRYDTLRMLKDRVKHRVAAGLKKGDLVLRGNSFVQGDFIAWARGKWPSKFFNYLANLKLNFHSATSAKASMTMVVTHQSIDQCRDALNEALKKISELETENASLRPDAEKYLENCSTNKKNARARKKIS